MTMVPVPTTKDEFGELVRAIEYGDSYRRPIAYGFGLATCVVDDSGAITKTLDTRFLIVNFDGENAGVAALLHHLLGGLKTGAIYCNEHNNLLGTLVQYLAPYDDEPDGHPNRDVIRRLHKMSIAGAISDRQWLLPVLAVLMDLDDAPVSVPDIYLRLHLLSQRRVKPNEVNVRPAEIFPILPTVAWTAIGPVDPELFEEVNLDCLFDSGLSLHIHSLDKLPPMLDYVIPSGAVRVADAARVRLGAHLADGTTVMQAGFVNFNAGTLGKSMVEGRISQGVVVGDGTDLGGSSSTMGTMSGGGKEIVSIGENCLIGANGGTGISLGDNCTIEAGLYITAGTPVEVTMNDGATTVAKARELSGQSNILFRRDGQTGKVTASKVDGFAWGSLNEVLHT